MSWKETIHFFQCWQLAKVTYVQESSLESVCSCKLHVNSWKVKSVTYSPTSDDIVQISIFDRCSFTFLRNLKMSRQKLQKIWLKYLIVPPSKYTYLAVAVCKKVKVSFQLLHSISKWNYYIWVMIMGTDKSQQFFFQNRFSSPAHFWRTRLSVS